MPNKIHEGRNIKRFREMLGIKQEALAMELGDDWTQKKISLLEQKDSVEPLLLQQVADVLKIPAEVFKNFDEEQAVNIIANTIDNGAIGYQRNDACTFNPIEMLVQLHEEKIALYERMLKEKDELIEQFERMVDSKK
jgi:transcriptional regulator with XRE-family HTH domain